MDDTHELQAINTAWQVAIQEILRVVIRDLYRESDEVAFLAQMKRLEEVAVDCIQSEVTLRGATAWTETLVKEKASNFVTNLLTSLRYDTP